MFEYVIYVYQTKQYYTQRDGSDCLQQYIVQFACMDLLFGGVVVELSTRPRASKICKRRGIMLFGVQIATL